MTNCSAITKSGKPCSHKARVGFESCGKHADWQADVVQHRCREVKTDGERCKKMAANGHICACHVRVRQARAQAANVDEIWYEIMDRMWGIGQPPAVLAEIMQYAEDTLIGGPNRLYYQGLLLDRIANEFAHYNRRQRQEVKGDLHRIALDNQSIHARAVNTQTNTSLEKLLDVEEAMAESDDAVLAGVYHTIANATDADPKFTAADCKKMFKDVNHWFNTATCRAPGDHLYRRCLRGLWCMIMSSAHCDDLCMRLLEELKESLSTCCDGHIGRLCNVMVGFDESFVPEVAPGELLQQRMAMIAAKECCVEEKVGHAWAVFEELKVPLVERGAWIEAF